jgi:predicted ribosomally synthesized peptide with SipW-like signal peptide
MNKKVWFSIAMIAVVVALAAGGTYAYFTATRTASTNKFVAGTLDLNVQSNGNDNEPFIIENMGDNANIAGTKTWTIKNTGTLPGRLLVRLQNLSNEENGCNDQEMAAEPNCKDDNLGELGKVVNLNVALDGTDVASSTLATAQMTQIGSEWSNLTPIIIPAGGTRTVTTHWAADENSYGNEIQSDSTQFDMNFRLIQQINGEAPSNI